MFVFLKLVAHYYTVLTYPQMSIVVLPVGLAVGYFEMAF